MEILNYAYTQTKENVTIEAHGHSWSDPTYTWSDDYGQCTATRVCANDASHVETETVNTMYELVNPTCTADGSETFVAVSLTLPSRRSIR